MQPKIKTLNLLRLSSGDDLALQVYQFLGKQSGRKTYIQANLHGAEIVGNLVIKELIDWLVNLEQEELIGEVWLVPGCNPVGMNQRSHFFASGRYNSYDGKDWNRIFWDYNLAEQEVYEFAKNYLEASPEVIYQDYLEKLRTQLRQREYLTQQESYVPYSLKYQQILQSLCLDAHTVIDIHSSSNRGIDYLFTFPGQEEMTNTFLLEVGILVETPEGYTFDEAFIKPWLSLKKAFAQWGRNLDLGLYSWTLELGSGMSASRDSVEKGVRGIKNYLATQGIVKASSYPRDEGNYKSLQIAKKEQIRRYYSPTGGMIKTIPNLRQKVRAGEMIYQILKFNKTGEKPEVINIQAETAGLIFDVGINQGVNEGEYVLTVLEEGDQNG